MRHKLRTLWRLMEGYRYLYMGAVGSILLATMFSYGVPLVIRIAVDSAIGGKEVKAPDFILGFIQWLGGLTLLRSNLWIFTIVLVILVAFQGIFTYLKGRLASSASESIACNLRDRLYDHLQSVPVSFHCEAETGDLIQRCTSDVETIRRFLAMQLVEMGRAMIMIALVVPIMFALDSKMALVSLAVVPVIFFFALIFFTKVKKTFQIADEAEGELSTVLQENLTGIRVVRAFARQDYEKEKFEQKNSRFRDLSYRLVRLIALYWAMSDFLCLSQIAVVVIMGTIWSISGTLSLGTFIVFISYEAKILWPVRHMGRILTDLGKTFVSLGRIEDILSEPLETKEIVEKSEIEQIKGKIVFSNVSFSYNKDNTILKNISFEAAPGQTVAIMGPTGSGKSTLIKLLLRLYDYEQGSITIDDMELRKLDRKWIRKQVAVVLQEPFLYSKTVRDNIRLGNALTKETDIIDVAKTADIHEAILNFKDGYNTEVGEQGIALSGGQKQRVAIARALLQKTPVIVFDDSLSAVDTETETRIQRALRNKKGKATTFIIAHRLTSLMDADLILVLDKGEIKQTGTHNQLINEEGLYQRIWNMQNQLDKHIQNRSTA